MTQQAVSARLRSIEAQTGFRLALRTARGSHLTPAGVVVAQWADRLLDVAQDVDAGLTSLRTESRKRIKVVASLTIAEPLMAPWLVSLQTAATRCGRTAPDVILTATNSDHAISAVRGMRSACASYCPIFRPSPHHPPHPLPGRRFPPDVTDDRVLNDLDVQSR